MNKLITHILALTFLVNLSYALEEDIDFAIIANAAPVPTSNSDIKVIEFFNFSCPACNASQPYIDDWLEDKPEQVIWQRTPVPFQRWGGLYARLFFVLEGFNKDEELFRSVFRALHKERKLLNSEGRIVDWLVEDHGFDEDKTEKAFSSFAVDTKMRKNQRLVEQYGVTSTPTIVVADRYLLLRTSGTGFAGLLDKLDELIEDINDGNAI